MGLSLMTQLKEVARTNFNGSPPDSEEAADFATPEQRKNVAKWKTYERVPPKDQFEDRDQKRGTRKTSRRQQFRPPLDARPDLESALNSWKTAVSPEVQIDWFSLAKVGLERSKPVDHHN